MGRICAASFCCNKSTNTKGTTSFFRFPKNVADRNKWASLVGRNDLINTSSKTIQSLCSDHFDNSCISQKSLGRLRLVSGAMPNPVKVVTNDSMDPIPISHFVHNDHDYQKRPDLIKLTNEAAPSIVICPANVKQKEDVTMGSDLKFFEKPVNKFYNRLTDHTYVKLIEPPPFKEISSVECFDPSRYMVQTLNESENIVDEQCVLDSSKSNEPGNIPSSENTENSCLEVIKTVKRHPRRNWKKVALARSNTINDLQEKVIGLQTKIKKKNIKLEKLRFYKLQYMMSQLQQSRQENNNGQRNVDG